MAFGIILYNGDRRIVAIDDTAAILFQVPVAELLGRSLYEFIPQPDREAMAEARATFERLGEASGEYALERDDGSQQSIIYRVLGNAPIAGVNLMAITPSGAEIANDESRVRRVGNDVFTGADVSGDERWFGGGGLRMPGPLHPAGAVDPGSKVVAAVFPTEDDAWAALLEAQHGIAAWLDLGLSSFDGGWPRDRRSVLAIRGGDGHDDAIAAIIAEFGGTLLAGGRAA